MACWIFFLTQQTRRAFFLTRIMSWAGLINCAAVRCTVWLCSCQCDVIYHSRISSVMYVSVATPAQTVETRGWGSPTATSKSICYLDLLPSELDLVATQSL
jgi:hypothetical protein